MNGLNYHHLQYFHAVAHDGQLVRTAQRLNLSQSALSMQIKQLEARMGHALFNRVGRRLELTEAGRIALEHADRIFGAGEELLATLAQTTDTVPPLKVGALSTLSRNFQLQFLEPLLADGTVQLNLKSGQTAGLLEDLDTLKLDVVLTTERPPSDSQTRYIAQRISQQAVGLHGLPAMKAATLKELLDQFPVILPSDSAIRSAFDDLMAQRQIQPKIAALVDDMAMIRLLARQGAGLALAPSVVLADEIATGLIATAPFDLDIQEPFFAVTVPRSFPHPAVARLLTQTQNAAPIGTASTSA